MIFKRLVAAAIGMRIFQAAGHRRPIGGRPEEYYDALNRKMVTPMKKYIVLQRPLRQVGVVGCLKLEMHQPGLLVRDSQHFICFR